MSETEAERLERMRYEVELALAAAYREGAKWMGEPREPEALWQAADAYARAKVRGPSAVKDTPHGSQ